MSEEFTAAGKPAITDESDTVIQVLIALRRLQQANSDANVRAAASLGLNRTLFQTVSYLSVHKSATALELSQVLAISPGAVTRVVDQLSELGLVQRQTGTDRRQIIMTLSTAGIAAADSVGRQYWNAVSTTIPPQRLETTLNSLTELANALETLTPSD